MKRIDKENYYLDIAETVAERSTCLRRCYGAIIVRNDEIIATGYNGAPRGRRNCVDLNCCTREALKIPSGERYELCRSVHAEANAIISAARSETLEPRSIWPARTLTPVNSSPVLPPVPCAAGSSSMPAFSGWSSATPRQTTLWSMWRIGYGGRLPAWRGLRLLRGR